MENIRYKVVVNHQLQYALWIDGKRNAPGWHDVGIKGMKENCLAYIHEVWTDMRPLRLREVAQHNQHGTQSVSGASVMLA